MSRARSLSVQKRNSSSSSSSRSRRSRRTRSSPVSNSARRLLALARQQLHPSATRPLRVSNLRPSDTNYLSVQPPPSLGPPLAHQQLSIYPPHPPPLLGVVVVVVVVVVVAVVVLVVVAVVAVVVVVVVVVVVEVEVEAPVSAPRASATPPLPALRASATSGRQVARLDA